MRLQEGDGFNAADFDVRSIGLGQAHQGRSHAWPVDLDAQESRVRSFRGHADERVPVPEPDVQHARAGTVEEARGCHCLVPAHINTIARPQLAQRRLLPARALALPPAESPRRRRRAAEAHARHRRDYREEALHATFSIDRP